MHSGTEVREVDRVREHTAEEINACIDARTDDNIRRYAALNDSAIEQRIRTLDEEWDIERALEATAASFGLSGAVLAATVDKKWLWLTGTVLGFLAMHSLSGWCPPVPVLRRLGVRTRKEIDREKYALKTLRGDFSMVPTEGAAGVPNGADEELYRQAFSRVRT